MYIFELIFKYINKKKSFSKDFDPLNSQEKNDDESEFCEHIFMPIDSTGDILACSKCGLVVNKKDLKKKNIFKFK
ncbi:hypothetical protein J6E39_00200 [bacterium]|nr:hypothetical protein [bacterium]